MTNRNRTVIDGITLPDDAAIEHQRRKERPAHQDQRIQPSVHDIQEEGYRRYIEEQQRHPPKSDRGVYEISIGGDDDE